MTAKFKAASTFAITGRGLILAGEISEGVVKIGMKVRVPSYSEDLTINGISPIGNVQNPGLVGLLFSSDNEDEFIRWKELDLKDQVLEIFDESD